MWYMGMNRKLGATQKVAGRWYRPTSGFSNRMELKPMSNNSTKEVKDDVSNGENEHERDIETMRNPEFWQRIALEAVVNDDPAKALSLRVEAFFSGAECYPRQPDTLRVVGVCYRELFEWMIAPVFEFEFETTEEDEQGVLVCGIEYSQFGDEFSTDSESESADEEFIIDGGQDIDQIGRAHV